MSPLVNLGSFLIQNQLHGRPLHRSSGTDFFQDDLESKISDASNASNISDASNAPDASNASNAFKAVGTPTNCSVEDLVNCLDKLCLEVSKLISTTSSASPPVQPPSPKLAPVQVIAGVHQSSRVCHTVSRNRDYQRTLDEEAE